MGKVAVADTPGEMATGVHCETAAGGVDVSDC